MRGCGLAARMETMQVEINLASKSGRIEHKTMRRLSSNSLVFGNPTVVSHLHMVKVCTELMEHLNPLVV